MSEAKKNHGLIIAIGLGKKKPKKDGGKVEGGRGKSCLGKYARGGKAPEYKDKEEKDQPEQETAWGKMKNGGGIHIKKSHEGLLHKDLKVKAGEKIPEKKLEKAKNSEDPAVRKRATFAENAKKFKH